MAVFRRYSAGANETSERRLRSAEIVRARAHEPNGSTVIVSCNMYTRNYNYCIARLSAAAAGGNVVSHFGGATFRASESRELIIPLARRSNCFAKSLRCIKVMDARWAIAPGFCRRADYRDSINVPDIRHYPRNSARARARNYPRILLPPEKEVTPISRRRNNPGIMPG